MAASDLPVVLLVGGSSWPSTIVLAQRLRRAGVVAALVDAEDRPGGLSFVEYGQANAFSPQDLAAELQRWRSDPRLRLVLPMVEDWMPLCEEIFAGAGLLLHEGSSLALETLLSKSAMLVQARQAGLNVPHSEPAQDLEHALGLACRWGYPVMLKGDTGQGGGQVRRCADPQEIAQAWEVLSAQSLVSVQEFIPGHTWGAGAFFLAGRPCRVHIYEGLPLPDTPANIPAERIRHVSEPTALQALHQLGRHLGWTGYGQIDFIRRPDGLLFFLEFNPRLWSSVTAADAAGNDLLGVLADRALGRPVIEDLDNRDGWTSLVYPKPVHRLLRAGRFWPLLRLLIQGEFHRSRPRHSWSLELGSRFLRTAYWSWQNGRKSRI